MVLIIESFKLLKFQCSIGALKQVVSSRIKNVFVISDHRKISELTRPSHCPKQRCHRPPCIEVVKNDSFVADPQVLLSFKGREPGSARPEIHLQLHEGGQHFGDPK